MGYFGRNPSSPSIIPCSLLLMGIIGAEDSRTPTRIDRVSGNCSWCRCDIWGSTGYCVFCCDCDIFEKSKIFASFSDTIYPTVFSETVGQKAPPAGVVICGTKPPTDFLHHENRSEFNRWLIARNLKPLGAFLLEGCRHSSPSRMIRLSLFDSLTSLFLSCLF